MDPLQRITSSRSWISGSRSNSVEISATLRCARARSSAQTGAASRVIALATEHPARPLAALFTGTFFQSN
jgi:hypothetical protein